MNRTSPLTVAGAATALAPEIQSNRTVFPFDARRFALLRATSLNRLGQIHAGVNRHGADGRRTAQP